MHVRNDRAFNRHAEEITFAAFATHEIEARLKHSKFTKAFCVARRIAFFKFQKVTHQDVLELNVSVDEALTVQVPYPFDGVQGDPYPVELP